MNTTTSTRAQEFRDQLSRRVIVADGAMGTMLYSRRRLHQPLLRRAESLAPRAGPRTSTRSTSRPGAEILETNTFGANRTRLAAFGFAEKLQAINQAGVRLAREAAGDQAFVAGAIGPLGVRIEPLGPTSFAEARAIFREQVEALVEAGVDLLILETFSRSERNSRGDFRRARSGRATTWSSSRKSPSR